MSVSKEQLIDALYNEYVFLCHDDFDPDQDATPEEYLEMLKEMSYDELVEETGTDEIFSMDEFMSAWGCQEPINLFSLVHLFGFFTGVHVLRHC